MTGSIPTTTTTQSPKKSGCGIFVKLFMFLTFIFIVIATWLLVSLTKKNRPIFNIDNADYKINSTSVLSSTALGEGVTSSSLTSVGPLTSLTVLSPIIGYSNSVVPEIGQMGNIQSGVNVARENAITSNTLVNIMSITLNTGTYLLQGWFIPEPRGAAGTKTTFTVIRVGIQESPETMLSSNNNNVYVMNLDEFHVWYGHSTPRNPISVQTIVNVVDTKTYYLNVIATFTSDPGAATSCRESQFFATRLA